MMEKKIGYLVLEVGYEYNDEYYHAGSYGTTYEAPERVYMSKERAVEELKKRTMESLRGEDLGRYGGDGLTGICKKGMEDKFEETFKEMFPNKKFDDWRIEIPKDATDEQLSRLIEFLKLEFFELVEVELE